MKKYLFLILAASITLTGCNKKKEPENHLKTEGWFQMELEPEQKIKTPAEPSYLFVNTLDGVNVRDNPGGNKLAKLPFDEKVEFLEKGAYEEIDGYRKYWMKIRTNEEVEGYVYGAYLSESISDAQEFRRNEQLGKAFPWLEKYEEEFRKNGVEIDENPYNITDYDLYPISLEDGNSLSFMFNCTYDKEKDSPGVFLYQVQIYCDDEYYPDFLPFRIGDPVEKVYEYFGRENATNRSDGLWWCDNCSICMKVQSENNCISNIIIKKCGW